MNVTTTDGVQLATYQHGPTGGPRPPILFLHEFGGDHRSWQPQVDHFAADRHCITYDARGYPQSSVPTDPEAYSQNHAVADAIAVLDALDVEKAVVVGNSMGGFATLHLGLRHPERCHRLVVAGCGYGAHPDHAEDFRADALALAESYLHEGSAAVAAEYGNRPARQPLRHRDPAAHERHLAILAEHDPNGAALTMRGVQAARPSLYDLRDEIAALAVPTLLVVGDQDHAALEANLMLRATIPDAGLAVLPRTGHLTNLELPAVFNQLVADFLTH